MSLTALIDVFVVKPSQQRRSKQNACDHVTGERRLLQEHTQPAEQMRAREQRTSCHQRKHDSTGAVDAATEHALQRAPFCASIAYG